MPKIALYKALTFFVYMYDIMYERPHLHVKKNQNNALNAKIWLDDLTFAEIGDFSTKELNQVQKIVQLNKIELMERLKPINLS